MTKALGERLHIHPLAFRVSFQVNHAFVTCTLSWNIRFEVRWWYEDTEILLWKSIFLSVYIDRLCKTYDVRESAASDFNR